MHAHGARGGLASTLLWVPAQSRSGMRWPLVPPCEVPAQSWPLALLLAPQFLPCTHHQKQEELYFMATVYRGR